MVKRRYLFQQRHACIGPQQREGSPAHQMQGFGAGFRYRRSPCAAMSALPSHKCTSRFLCSELPCKSAVQNLSGVSDDHVCLSSGETAWPVCGQLSFGLQVQGRGIIFPGLAAHLRVLLVLKRTRVAPAGMRRPAMTAAVMLSPSGTSTSSAGPAHTCHPFVHRLQ